MKAKDQRIFLEALDELEKEKGIKKEELLEAIETALLAAYKKVLTGDLLDFINNEVVVNTEGTTVNIPLEKVKKANLIFEMPDFKEEV